MHFFLSIALLFCLTLGFGQDQKEINDQVWKPFTEAIMTQNHQAFIALHSKDVIRVERNGKKVLTHDDYKKGMEENWPRWKDSMSKNGGTYTFELRFSERLSNGTQAYEVGYFKNTVVDKHGKKSESYGRFHVALRKENGVWKILVDSDSNEGGTITEEMFQAAQALE
jgi:ketosteroid isomerase-like protein